MAKTNLGRVMPVDKGAYNAATTYAKLDMVHSSDSTYVSKVDKKYRNMRISIPLLQHPLDI